MILLSSFIFGLIFGSFLNVIIYRLKTRQNIVFGGSFCSECKTGLKWHDLIPLLSFVFLRGRCRYCRKKISWQYPIVEILSGFIWLGVFYQNFNNFQFFPLGGIPHSGTIFNFQSFSAFYQIFIFSALLVIAVYDFKWKIIPDKIVYPAIAAALIYNFNIPSLLTAIIAFSFFFSIYFFSNGKAMGLGDAKLAILIGLFLGPPAALAAFTLAFVIGAAFGIMLIALGKKTFKSQVAFGPFMAIGAVFAFFLSSLISNFINLL